MPETLTRPDGTAVRVLVVDDEVVLADLLSSALRAAADRCEAAARLIAPAHTCPPERVGGERAYTGLAGLI